MNRTVATRLSMLAIGIVLAGLAGTRPAEAQTSGDRWQFILAPYIWGASLDGAAVVRGQKADIDLSASEIYDHLDLGYMLMFVARTDDWGVTGDVVWVDLGVDSPMANVDPSLAIATFQGVRRLSKIADLTFGARYSRLNTRVDFKAPINLEVEQTRDWVDPVVGVVLKTPGDRRWHATVLADVGGTGSSQRSWQIFPTIGFDMSKRASIEFGYRFLGSKYENGSGSDRFEYDVHYQGPAAGLAIRF